MHVNCNLYCLLGVLFHATLFKKHFYKIALTVEKKYLESSTHAKEM
jgi:hypothetical protein